eukprot:TRINITY_DN5084_c2_g1_i3.p1 TRINITY_DN5084_c2_g1~~TRINITY_DN5084_c2_g1_i3.p1  ORF type:complete len:103 (+),score=18.08 TRINITY_DN5084_c2_g1_i3:1346-1654(+)
MFLVGRPQGASCLSYKEMPKERNTKKKQPFSGALTPPLIASPAVSYSESSRLVLSLKKKKKKKSVLSDERCDAFYGFKLVPYLMMKKGIEGDEEEEEEEAEY